MFDAAAKDWIAPYWQNLRDHYAVEQPAQVWIWNPGPNPTPVTVRFYNSDGGIVTRIAQTVPSLARRLFEAATQGEPWEDTVGWCHITSEHPVLPWGFTGYATNIDDGFANMTFYRGDAEILNLHAPTTAPHK